MSRAPTFCPGRLGKPKITGLSLEPQVQNLVESNQRLYTCHILDRRLALLGVGKGWLAQYQDNMTEWDGAGGLVS